MKTADIKEFFIKHKYGIAAVFAVCYIPICELVFSLGLGLGLTFFKLMFAASLGLLVLFVGTAPKRKLTGFILQAVITGAASTFYVTQYTYFKIFDMPYLVNSISGAGDAMSFLSVAANSFFGSWPVSIWLFVVVVVFYTWYRKLYFECERPQGIKKKALIAWLISAGVSIGAPFAFSSEYTGAAGLILYEYRPISCCEELGLLPSMLLDVKANVFGVAGEAGGTQVMSGAVIEEAPKETVKPQETIEPSASAEATEQAVYEPNVMDISFNMSEEDETLREMNGYFSSREPTMKNEYTGMFEGKNLILITAEGFSGYVIDPQLTPTLYKLANEGFRFNNFYTPLWYVSTSDGEYVATTGLLPKSGVWSYTQIEDNYMPFAFGNQFAKMGYETLAFHNHSYTYYNRDRSYPAMGYTYYAKNHGLEVTDQWPESDVEMMDLSVPMYVNSDNFHIYYLTVSGHLEYNFEGNEMCKKHEAEVRDLTYSEHVKAYIACQLELEDALCDLINRLKSAGKLEDTVIALSADHYPYGLTNEEYAELMGVSQLDTEFDMYKNSFLLWNSEMETPVDVDKVCSSLDIAPTLSNLFNLEYDSRLYMGRDMLSDSPGLVVFEDRSFITDEMRYDAGRNTITRTGGSVSEEKAQATAQEAADMFKYSKEIIDNDYYAYILNK